ncbi:hypothetical protein A2Z22_00885 [Candidatus Woesebacteria bacterium RBG_16_34_12]|uniref:Nudix hydrolase domain-containing protein n=1 Tax=Candidatus Woesebacteria bacterium RBG_16_34_12 TaxID=1802480 RepID=A0A1F7X8Q0_9BACT|nr:MAG: hypothetical protein A2Z22_00885 [Candidatus Woesebacteria bacterium RBG_16_34_12]
MNQVVVGIISRETRRGIEYLLLSSKRDFGKFTGFYYPPGGHLENGENEENALVREIKEELRIKVKPINKVAETSSDIKGQLTHWWMCQADTSKIKIQTDEIKNLRWFTREEIIKSKNIWPATKNIFQKYIFDKS